MSPEAVRPVEFLCPEHNKGLHCAATSLSRKCLQVVKLRPCTGLTLGFKVPELMEWIFRVLEESQSLKADSPSSEAKLSVLSKYNSIYMFLRSSRLKLQIIAHWVNSIMGHYKISKNILNVSACPVNRHFPTSSESVVVSHVSHLKLFMEWTFS